MKKLFKKILKNKFVKNYFKLISGVLFIISTLITLKLFWLTGEIGFGCSGGFISLCLIPEIGYLPGGNTVISIILGVLLFKIYKKNKSKKIPKFMKLKSILIIFVVSLFAFPLFNIISPKLSFVFKKAENLYYDSNGNIEVDKYLKYMIKYCIDDKYNTCYKGKFESDLGTVENFIKALDVAKENDFRKLYSITINGIERANLFEEVIKKYNDKTFYAYVIDYEWENINLMNLIKEKTEDIAINNLINFSNSKLSEWNKIKKGKDIFFENEYWDKFNKEMNKMLKQINGINHKVF